MATRRSREPESDDQGDSSRAGTPISTAPSDRKRSRRTADQEQILSPQVNGTSRNSPVQEDKKPVILNGALSNKPKHQPGAVVRVKLTNFVTYTSAEFFPGPGLNMVVGPNGTGKSTLVCAICLGLGWGTSVLGRAKEPSEFIKHGCREATIEIELQRATEGEHRSKRNPIFTRTIKRDGNKSTYTLSGRSSNQKLFQELARRFNIQIDNLCQFLPQDKVVEFAAMTPVELLKSTQQTAAPAEMLECHEELKHYQQRQRDLLADYKHDKEQIANLKNRQEMNRVDVEKMREKVETQKRLDWLQKCRPAPQYAEAKQKALEARQTQKQLTTELKKLKDELAPTLRMVNAKEEYFWEVGKLKRQREKDLRDAEKDCDGIDEEDTKLKDKIADCDRRIDSEIKSRPSKRRDLMDLQRKATQLKAEMARPRPEFDTQAINAQIQERIERRRQIEAGREEQKTVIENLKIQGEARNARIRELKKQLEDLDTKSGQQQNKLSKAFPETYRAWEWIQQNKDKFEAEVYGPPIVSCSLKDSSMADKVESFLRDTDFKFITFQNQRDFEVMRRQMKRMGLHDVSLRTCSINSLDQFRSPLSSTRLQQLGLDSWAIDYIDGPPNVLAMYCQENRLHQAGIANREINDEQYNEIAKAGMISWVAGKTSYTITRRKEYGSAGESTKTSQIRPARIWTDTPVDASGDKARLQREIGEVGIENNEIMEQFKEAKAESHRARDEIASLEKEIAELREQKDTHQRAMAAFNALPTRLQDIDRKVMQLLEALGTIQDRIEAHQKQRDGYLVQRAEAAARYASAVSKVKEKLESLLEVEMWLIEAQSDYETLRSRNEGINQLLTQKKEEEREAAEAAGREAEKARELMRAILKLKEEADNLESQQGDRGLLKLMEKLGEEKTTTEQLEAMIESDQAKLELIQGLDGSVVQDFERRAQRIEELEERQKKTSERLDAVHDIIRETRNKWEPKLDELVARISDKFGESFSRIGCAGQVVVYKASSGDSEDEIPEQQPQPHADRNGNGLDFANWAIHVSVKFRENEPLSLLDAHRQSGGERAVATIFYLMALQSLSRAPFRVVDEINQGMDPRNERMVHGRMVDICSPATKASDRVSDEENDSQAEESPEGAGSQYFLMTPKLLSGLKYRRGMTVLCIVSGENMPAAVDRAQDGTEVQEKPVRRTGKKKTGDTGGGDEGSSPKTKTLWAMDFARFVERARHLRLSDVTLASAVGQGGRRVDSGIGIAARSHREGSTPTANVAGVGVTA